MLVRLQRSRIRSCFAESQGSTLLFVVGQLSDLQQFSYNDLAQCSGMQTESLQLEGNNPDEFILWLSVTHLGGFGVPTG